MSLAGPVNLLNPVVKENFNIKLLKKHSVSQVKQENILQKLAFMSTFEEISDWVSTHSNGQKYIANPISAGDADRLDCLFAIQEPLALALKPLENRRKNGRDIRLLEATETDNYAVIADILASTAWSYWQNHNFQTSQDVRVNISVVCQFQNDENIQQKKEFKKAQIEHIGAIVDFCKANKKGAFQECLDFKETEEILGINDFED
ncbi:MULTISPECIES: hypothetical protein [unclassified Sulfurospirillum]|uniref:hypothetical protein n=1 Tax=unclassified Sulfurospirillum TaxID=2618290 RepID=UPI000507173C|nr:MULTISPECIES: hypothetical protein [unclassified Sulfurospirillum]KFL35003.1 hypothetical protein JU57_03305 [Sulfurospirillum sp. SCADC]